MVLDFARAYGHRMNARHRLPLATASAALAALLLAGCSTSEYDSSSSGGADGGWSAPVEGLEPNEAAADDGRSVVTTGTISMTVDDPIAAAEEAGRIVTDAGGRVDAREQSAPRGSRPGSASLTLRIPSTKLDQVRDSLAELGRVDDTFTQSVDVGVQQRDLEARIATLRTTIARYSGWLETAETTKDLIELESAIAERQTELERLEAQQRALLDQVTFSTIDLYLYAEDTAVASGVPTDFGSALGVGWNAFVAFWTGAVVVVGVLAPWIALLAVIGSIVWAIVRAKRRAAPAPPTAPAPAAAPASPAPAPAAPAAPVDAPASPER